jgi:hypothetical protein
MDPNGWLSKITPCGVHSSNDNLPCICKLPTADAWISASAAHRRNLRLVRIDGHAFVGDAKTEGLCDRFNQPL